MQDTTREREKVSPQRHRRVSVHGVPAFFQERVKRVKSASEAKSIAHPRCCCLVSS